MSGNESGLQVPKEWNNLKRSRANNGGSTKGRDTVKKRFKSEAIVTKTIVQTP